MELFAFAHRDWLLGPGGVPQGETRMVEHSIVGSEWSFGCRMMIFLFRRRMLQVLWDGSCVFHLALLRALRCY